MNIIERIIGAIKNCIHGPMTKEEVERALNAIEVQRDERLDWKHSIVDLLKLLKLDASLQGRKEMASELGYRGVEGTEAMNTWLHEEVMDAVARHYVKLP